MKAAERGVAEVLRDAEGLARVLRLMTGGKLSLVPVVLPAGLELSWAAALTEASEIARKG